MLIQRRVIVMLIVILGLSACKQSEAPPIDDIFEGTPANNLVYNISLELQWLSANPGNRWSQAGRELVSENVSTVILIRVDAKDESGQAFETILENLTADNVIIETTENGVLYGRASSEVSEHVIYRDFPAFVVTLTLIDKISDTVDRSYINDWERIALEGNLFIVE